MPFDDAPTPDPDDEVQARLDNCHNLVTIAQTHHAQMVDPALRSGLEAVAQQLRDQLFWLEFWISMHAHHLVFWCALLFYTCTGNPDDFRVWTLPSVWSDGSTLALLTERVCCDFL